MILTWNLDQYTWQEKHAKLKKIEYDVMSENFDFDKFPIYGQFRAIRKPDFRRVVCKTYTLIRSKLSSYKHRKQN